MAGFNLTVADGFCNSLFFQVSYGSRQYQAIATRTSGNPKRLSPDRQVELVRLLQCAGRAKRRRRFGFESDLNPNRCPAALATALHKVARPRWTLEDHWDCGYPQRADQ